jgi:Heparinase II/III-like protein
MSVSLPGTETGIPAPRGVLESRFTIQRLARRLPPSGAWRPYPALGESEDWGVIHPPTRAHLLTQAEAVLAGPWPLLTASGYARYSQDGDRQAYERPYFARRARLAAAVIRAALAGPDTERVCDITDGIWLLCEETSWCLPAHDTFAQRRNEGLPDPARPCLDLFAADTAALLAYTDLLAGDLIGSSVRRRLRDEVRQRVLRPYRDDDTWWWLGHDRRDLNNWTTWIHSNVLPASLLLDSDPRDILATAGRTVAALDRYLDSVADDGGCDEGISYWWRAGGCLFECLQVLASACGDDYGVFEIPQIRNIARYPLVAHISGGWQVNFADGDARPRGEAAPRLLYRFGRAIGDPEVVRHARALRGDRAAAVDLVPSPGGSLARVLGAALDAEWAAEPPEEFPMPAQTWLPGTGVLTARERAGTARGLFLAAKAGHNAESHNHNDVGSFIVALDGRPLLIDVGVGIYTKQTFGPQRYEIWTMQSSWHNLPEVDGVPQQAGRERAAGRVRATLTDGAAELTMDLASAYPPAARIGWWLRTMRLERAGAGGRGSSRVLIDDSWDINHDPERIVLHLISPRPPRPGSLGRILLAADDGDLAIGYPDADFAASIEERPLADRQLAAIWGPVVYRIALTARRPARRGSARLEIAADRAGRVGPGPVSPGRGG